MPRNTCRPVSWASRPAFILSGHFSIGLRVWESFVLKDQKKQKVEAGSWFINKKNIEKNLKQGGNLVNVFFNCRGLHNLLSSVKVRPQKTPPQSVRFLGLRAHAKGVNNPPFRNAYLNAWTLLVKNMFLVKFLFWQEPGSDGFPRFYLVSRVAIPFWIFCNRQLLLPETVG